MRIGVVGDQASGPGSPPENMVSVAKMIRGNGPLWGRTDTAMQDARRDILGHVWLARAEQRKNGARCVFAIS